MNTKVMHRVIDALDSFECEGCKETIHIDDVVGRITYMNGLYGFWCYTCWVTKR